MIVARHRDRGRERPVLAGHGHLGRRGLADAADELGVAGGAALGRRLGLSPRVALVAAIAVSSLGFAAAHHLDAPWEARAFAFRTVAGVGFALVFWHRSLAHAVYAHVLYDLWIAAAG